MREYNTGLFTKIRTRLFGERDVVAARLEDIGRQGSGLVRVAHFMAFVMLVIFSTGSLLALASDSFVAAVTALQSGSIDIPHSIIAVVSFLLVLCMDTAMVYAGLQVRIYVGRHARLSEYGLYIAVIAATAATEAGTYYYMSTTYEHATSSGAVALIAVRSVLAPLLAVFLTLARRPTPGPRDIAYEVELEAGIGLIRDIKAIASDPNIPLYQKAELYEAASDMPPEVRARFTKLVQVAHNIGSNLATGYVDADPNGPGGGLPVAHAKTGTSHEVIPFQRVTAYTSNDSPADSVSSGDDIDDSAQSGSGSVALSSGNVATLTVDRARAKRSRAAKTGRTRLVTTAVSQLREQQVDKVAAILRQDPSIPPARIATGLGVSFKKARGLITSAIRIYPDVADKMREQQVLEKVSQG